MGFIGPRSWLNEPVPDEVDPQDVRVIDRLASAEPIRRLLGRHVDYYGEILPTVVLAEVADWVGEQVSEGHPGRARPVLDALEQELRDHPAESDNLISVGFVESLGGETYAAEVRRIAPPLLAALCDELL